MADQPDAHAWSIGATDRARPVARRDAVRGQADQLLARLYDPDEGRILLDGHDLREYDLSTLRANIGVIFQDFVRYHFTAADNIAVGRIEAREDRARIVAAAERSLADEVIRSLPRGYDQVIGKRFRTGIDLPAASGRRSPLRVRTCATRRF